MTLSDSPIAFAVAQALVAAGFVWVAVAAHKARRHQK